MKNFGVDKIFILASILLLFVSLFWFFSSSAPLTTESFLRIVLGGLFIFLLPGLIWGEILGFRSNHALETIAVAFGLTIAIEVVLLPVPFLFAATIRLWIASIFAVCLAGTAILAVKSKAAKRFDFITPLFGFFKQPFPFSLSSALILIILAVVCRGVYRWGENLTDISGEKLLHMIFVRYYYSMPMILDRLCVVPGSPPSNIVHLWEYIIAGWASVIHMDPLPLFSRARIAIPFLGFSGMYLLVKNLFSDKVKTEVIFWAVLIMSLGGFMLISPSTLDWIKLDPYRLVSSFMGTVHHSDSAMDIMMALNIAVFLMVMRNRGKRYIFLLAGVSLAVFLWHPREFFQMVIYAGIFGLVYLILPGPGKEGLKRWMVAACVIAAVAIVIFPLVKAVPSQKSHGYDEGHIKQAAIKYALSGKSIFGVRNLFNIPSYLTLSSSSSPNVILSKKSVFDTFKKDWNYALWLIFSAIAIPFLTMWGDKEDKRLVLFYILLWFLVLGWNLSMLILIALTYSEIFITTPRFIYLFSYLIIASSLFLFCERLSRKMPAFKAIIAYAASMLVMGTTMSIWWRAGAPFKKALSFVLTAAVFLSLFFILFMAISKKNPRSGPYSLKPSLFIPAVLGILMFFYPVLAPDLNTNIKKLIRGKTSSMDWFGKNNFFGFSKELISHLRALPQQKMFLVYPLGKSMVSAYAPLYTVAIPEIVGTVMSNYSIYDEVRKGMNPLYSMEGSLLEYLPENYLNDKEPVFSSIFFKWAGPAVVDIRSLDQSAAPLINLGSNGKFNFMPAKEGSERVLRVTAIGNSMPEEREIQFGYGLGQNGFNIEVRPWQEAVFVLKARFSSDTDEPATIFVQDKADTWKRKSVTITGQSWKEYVVSKNIRDGVSMANFGIYWLPERDGEWMEVKDIRIFLIDVPKKATRAGSVPPNHAQVVKWLTRYNVDYILVEKNYYDFLAPYFKSHAGDYRITFDNPGADELVAQYLGGGK